MTGMSLHGLRALPFHNLNQMNWVGGIWRGSGLARAVYSASIWNTTNGGQRGIEYLRRPREYLMCVVVGLINEQTCCEISGQLNHKNHAIKNEKYGMEIISLSKDQSI